MFPDFRNESTARQAPAVGLFEPLQARAAQESGGKLRPRADEHRTKKSRTPARSVWLSRPRAMMPPPGGDAGRRRAGQVRRRAE